jgi:hypothetical protein
LGLGVTEHGIQNLEEENLFFWLAPYFAAFVYFFTHLAQAYGWPQVYYGF